MKLLDKLFKTKKPKSNTTENIASDLDISQREAKLEDIKLEPDLEKNITKIEEILGKSYDLTIRRFYTTNDRIPSAIIYMNGLVDNDSIQKILNSLLIDTLKLEIKNMKPILKDSLENIITSSELKELDKITDLFDGMLFGDTAVLFNGIPKALLCQTKGWETRAITEPEQETAIRGPREGFVENLRVNTGLLRKRMKTPNLWIESVKVGKLSKTEIGIAYIKGIANDKLVKEVRERLGRLDIDSIIESGLIEEYIQDEPYTVFPMLSRTERVDKVATELFQGRVAIITDGTPFVLLAPFQFMDGLTAPDDYYESMSIGSFLRLMRILAFTASILLPGVYVAVLTHHVELLPTKLLLSITLAREGVPFPLVVEALLMEILFELLREAGIRLPQAIGSAISIVGALILGEAAIAAGLVSPAMVIIIAITAIASFSSPLFSLAIAARIIRFTFIILGSIIGLFGIQLGILLLVIHLCSLRSFGYPYLAPYAPLIVSDLKDSVIRVSSWASLTRPKLLGKKEPIKQDKNQKPEPKNRRK